MSIGNFVAVNAYVSSMFAPLNFLGYIYQGIIQGENWKKRKKDWIRKRRRREKNLCRYVFFVKGGDAR